jgi:geranylgeranyl pyrophosphate synthase
VDFTQLGASGAVVAVVVIFLKFMRDEADKSRADKALDAKNRRKENALLIKAINKNTQITQSADTYLRQRNGRDIEKHTELLEATKAIPKTMQRIADTQAKTLLASLKKLPAQNIEHQHVKDQTIENST